jgi:hypothetical protein
MAAMKDTGRTGRKQGAPRSRPLDVPALVAAVAAWLVGVAAFVVVPFVELYRVAFSTSLLIALNGTPSEAELAAARRAPTISLLVVLAGLVVVAGLWWWRRSRGGRARDGIVLLALGVVVLVVSVAGVVLFRDAF